MSIYLIHEKCVVFSRIHGTEIDDYLRFQFKHFKARANVELPARNQIDISSEPAESGKSLVSCKTKRFEIAFSQLENGSYHVLVLGRVPKMLFNKILVLAFRFVLQQHGFHICHCAVIGDDLESALYFGSGGAGKTGTVMQTYQRSQGLFIHADDYCFVSNANRVLAVPRYFSVKANNFKYFRSYLSKLQRARFTIWARPGISKLLRRLPTRLGQAPVVHLGNFTYPKDKTPDATRIKTFSIIGELNEETAANFISRVNREEFFDDFMVKKRFGRHTLNVSDAVIEKIAQLDVSDSDFWRNFSSSIDIRLGAPSNG